MSIRCHCCSVTGRHGAKLEQVHACVSCRLDAPRFRERAEKAEARVRELEDAVLSIWRRCGNGDENEDLVAIRVMAIDVIQPTDSVCSDPEPDEVKVLESPDPAYQKGSIIRGPSFGDPKRIVTGIVYGQHSDGLDEWWVDTVDPDEKPSNMVLLTQPIEVLRFASEMAIKYRDYFPKSEPEKSCTNEATLSRDRARLIIAQARAAGDALDFGAGLETKIMAALDAPSVDKAPPQHPSDGFDPEHCDACRAFQERHSPPKPPVEVKSELWDAAKLKMRQLEGEIQRCSATQAEKSNMLHSFSKLTMFASDAWDMHVVRPAQRSRTETDQPRGNEHDKATEQPLLRRNAWFERHIMCSMGNFSGRKLRTIYKHGSDCKHQDEHEETEDGT